MSSKTTDEGRQTGRPEGAVRRRGGGRKPSPPLPPLEARTHRVDMLVDEVLGDQLFAAAHKLGLHRAPWLVDVLTEAAASVLGPVEIEHLQQWTADRLAAEASMTPKQKTAYRKELWRSRRLDPRDAPDTPEVDVAAPPRAADPTPNVRPTKRQARAATLRQKQGAANKPRGRPAKGSGNAAE